jgi:hypothetical protein
MASILPEGGTMRFLLTIIALSATLSTVQNQREADKWKLADAATVRLSPQSFHQLPHKIIRNLQDRGCTIPQEFGNSEPHNVISGDFRTKGQTDWAVLCSRKGNSSILVFWGGSVRKVSAIAPSPDVEFLQTIGGPGNIGFSRAISAVGRAYILKHYDDYGGPKPPRIDHQGIDDGFVGKASVVRYYYFGKWLELQGAD